MANMLVELRNKVESLSVEYDKSSARTQDLQESLHNVSLEIDAKDRELAELDSQISELKKRYENLREERSGLTGKVKAYDEFLSYAKKAELKALSLLTEAKISFLIL